MTSLALFGGFVLLLAFLALIAGIAICSHFDSQYMGGDDDCHP